MSFRIMSSGVEVTAAKPLHKYLASIFYFYHLKKKIPSASSQGPHSVQFYKTFFDCKLKFDFNKIVLLTIANYFSLSYLSTT